MTKELEDRIKTLEKANKQCQIGVIILALTVTFGGLWLYDRARAHHQVLETLNAGYHDHMPDGSVLWGP